MPQPKPRRRLYNSLVVNRFGTTVVSPAPNWKIPWIHKMYIQLSHARARELMTHRQIAPTTDQPPSKPAPITEADRTSPIQPRARTCSQVRHFRLESTRTGHMVANMLSPLVYWFVQTAPFYNIEASQYFWINNITSFHNKYRVNLIFLVRFVCICLQPQNRSLFY